MAYTQEMIDALKAALASGVLTVSHGDRTVTYRSLRDIRQLIQDMEAELSGTAHRRTVARFISGL